MTISIHPSRALKIEAAPEPSHRLEWAGGWWTLLLALAMLLSLTEALISAGWAEGLEVVRFAILGGALLGALLALTRWDGFFPAFYGLLAGTAWTAILLMRHLLPQFQGKQAVNELVGRNVQWVAALLTGTANADNLIFVTQLGYLGWWLGFLAMWSLMRDRRILVAVIPTGIALLVNAYYAQANLTPFVVLYLGAVLLLAVRLELARNQARWQAAHVRFAPDITLDFLKAGSLFAIAVLFFAWAVPDVANSATVERILRPLEAPWQRVTDTWERMYSSLNYGRSAVQVTNYGRSMTFGGPVNLTNRPIFQAETPERTYWRVASFDAYSSRGWRNTDDDVMIIERNRPLGEWRFDSTREITVTVHPQEVSQDVIFAPPQPVRVSVPVTADIRRIPGGDEAWAVSLLRSRIQLTPERKYDVVSAVTGADVSMLRSAGASYPSWVTDRFLQLPDSLPARVRDMAKQVTGATSTPYDAAVAIERWLRTYPYDQNIPGPPSSADGVDYFLFEIKRGYCDYYASAMTVMLRSLGIPARYVVGYTPGEVIARGETAEEPLTFQVLERNSHAWSEVYFPGHGWIQFEPTASEPALIRPAGPPTDPLEAGLLPDSGPLPGDDSTLLAPFQLPEPLPAARVTPAMWLARNWGWLVGTLAVIAGAVLGYRTIRTRRAALFQGVDSLAKLFALLGVWAARLHVSWAPSQTPLERAAGFQARLPESGPAVTQVAEMFVAELYGRQAPSDDAMGEVRQRWVRLEPRLWQDWARILFGLREPRRTSPIPAKTTDPSGP